MGLLSWVFGRFRKTDSSLSSKSPDTISSKGPRTLFLRGPGTFSLNTVGESYYQAALKGICGEPTYEGYEKVVEARLIHEDNNKYDTKAIRVDIEGQVVGYLSRKTAKLYRKRMQENSYSGSIVRCRALIVGGWDRGGGDTGNYGVKLDLPFDYYSIVDDGETSNCAVTQLGSKILTFNVAKLNRHELYNCEDGDYVQFVMPDENATQIVISKRYIDGEVLTLGYVPEKLTTIIASQLIQKLPIESRIVSTGVDDNIDECIIRSTLMSQEELAMLREKARRQFEMEVAKKYSPKKGFDFSIELLTLHDLGKGEALYLDKKPIEILAVMGFDSFSPVLQFVNEKGKLVGYKHNEPGKIRRIIRAKNSGYEITIRIQNVGPRARYLTHFHAMARVDFQRRGER